MIELHDYILSAEVYQVRLFLHLLDVPYKPVKTDIHPGRDNESRTFLALSPLGTLPVLRDGALVLHDPAAILTYLAIRHDAARTWLPQDATGAAQVAMWLGFAASELQDLSTLRMQSISARVTDREARLPRSVRALEVLDDHLAERERAGGQWMVGDAPTIADLALFPTVALAPDAGLAIDGHQSLWRWIGRIKRLPRFLVMPGIHPTLPDEH